MSYQRRAHFCFIPIIFPNYLRHLLAKNIFYRLILTKSINSSKNLRIINLFHTSPVSCAVGDKFGLRFLTFYWHK